MRKRAIVASLALMMAVTGCGNSAKNETQTGISVSQEMSTAETEGSASSETDNEDGASHEEAAVSEEMIRIPGVSRMSLEAAKKKFDDKGIKYEIEYVLPEGNPGTIKDQSIKGEIPAGELADTVVTLYVNDYKMPKLADEDYIILSDTVQHGTEELDKMGITYEIKDIPTDDPAYADRIIEQSVPAGTVRSEITSPVVLSVYRVNMYELPSHFLSERVRVQHEWECYTKGEEAAYVHNYEYDESGKLIKIVSDVYDTGDLVTASIAGNARPWEYIESNMPYLGQEVTLITYSEDENGATVINISATTVSGEQLSHTYTYDGNSMTGDKDVFYLDRQVSDLRDSFIYSDTQYSWDEDVAESNKEDDPINVVMEDGRFISCDHISNFNDISGSYIYVEYESADTDEETALLNALIGFDHKYSEKWYGYGRY
ncbi:MAG: hypothetical protein IJ149_07075 [Oscillospiraceae bacterium]|nr:hypothetical protein [Oscillospiraceae bacterium]